MGLGKRLSLLLILMGSSATSSHSFALEIDNEYFHVSGFATLALTRSGTEELGFHRDLDREGLFDGDWSFTADSILGLQLDFFATEKFGGAVQLVGKDRAEDSLDNSIEWAFLRYQLSPEWTLRAGRIGFDTFMLSEYRNVGFAYLWTRPPTEYYTIVSFPNFEGADIAWSSALGDGTLRIKAFTGDTKITSKLLGEEFDVELENIIGGSIGWESELWRLRFSATFNDFGEKGEYFAGTESLAVALRQVSPLWPEADNLADQLIINDNQINYYSLGAAYTSKPWQIQGEFSYSDSKTDAFASQLASYLSLGYQIEAFTPFVVLARAQTEGEPTIIPAAPVIPFAPELTAQLALLQQTTQFLYEAFNIDQTSLSLGMRWDVRYNLALKAQWDHSRINEHGFSLWDIRSVPTSDKSINTFSINLNLVF